MRSLTGEILAEAVFRTLRRRRPSPRGPVPSVGGTLLRRYLAFALDFVLVLLCGHLLGAWDATSEAGMLIAVTILFVYRVAFDALAGRTFGKLLLRVRTVPRGGSSEEASEGVGLRQALVRNLLLGLDLPLMVALVGFVVPLASGEGRRLGDLAAGTVVVPEKSLACKEDSEAERARREAGRRGERLVAGRLRALSDGGRYYLFDNLPEPAVGNIDHLVVGPCGLMIVETKANRGEVLIQGGRVFVEGAELPRNPLLQARRQAEFLHARLSEFCAAGRDGMAGMAGGRGLNWLVCFPRGGRVVVPRGENDAAAGKVVLLRSLTGRIRGLDRVLSDGEVDRLGRGVARTYGVLPRATPKRKLEGEKL